MGDEIMAKSECLVAVEKVFTGKRMMSCSTAKGR